MTVPVLRYGGDRGVVVDLDRLIVTRMLIQSNSGGGKSWAVRQLLEETHGRVQHLVIDPEGEFATLREKFDYVLAAKSGGDVIASPKTARLLCRRLMELGASAVLDLFELKPMERKEFVRLFLDELVALPKALWRPCLVVIDEAHIFAPEKGHGESQALQSVIDLSTLGRKRGFCCVLATQRISKLNKDAAADLNNKLIGRVGLDVDVKRAGDELGMHKDERQVLKRLDPGQFYVYGPAISNEIALVRTADVKTTHPEPGVTTSAAAPPAPKKVKAMLAQLADLPQQAEAEARTLEDLRRLNADLVRKLRQVEKDGVERVIEKPVVDDVAIARAVAAAVKPHQQQVARMQRQVERYSGALRTGLEGTLNALGIFETTMQELLADSSSHHTPESAPVVRTPPTGERPVTPASATRPAAARPSGDTSSGLPEGERVVLTAIAQCDDEGVDRDQLSVLTGYKRSTRNTYVSRLATKGLVSVRGDSITATDDGIAALGDAFEPLPTGEALQAYWMAKLPEGEARLLGLLLEAYPSTTDRESLSGASGYKRSTRNTYLSRLTTRRLVTSSGDGVRASDTLFGN